MTKEKLDMFIISKSKYFPAEALPMIREKLERLEDEKLLTLEALELKEPTTLLIVSLLAGSLGIDRFLLGDVGMGVLKILTCWCGIFMIVDWFTVMDRTKQKNLNKLLTAII